MPKQKHDIGQQKKAKNKALNPRPLSKEDRRKKWYKERGLPLPKKPQALDLM
jgi:hypothetical protein